MEQAVLPLLAAWESFYVIIGSSAAALTGLQFVVIVLGAEMGGLGGGGVARAFGTPTIVHFSAVLLISAMLSAPWHSLSSAAIALGTGGGIGVVYAMVIVWHARRQTEYKPVTEDWIFHFVLPLIAYALLLTSTLFLQRHAVSSLFAIGATSLLLLFTGIHNAWDSVVYIAFERRQQSIEAQDEKKRG